MRAERSTSGSGSDGCHGRAGAGAGKLRDHHSNLTVHHERRDQWTRRKLGDNAFACALHAHPPSTSEQTTGASTQLTEKYHQVADVIADGPIVLRLTKSIRV